MPACVFLQPIPTINPHCPSSSLIGPFRSNFIPKRSKPSSFQSISTVRCHLITTVLRQSISALDSLFRRRVSSETCASNSSRFQTLKKRIWKEIENIMQSEPSIASTVRRVAIGLDCYLSPVPTIRNLHVSPNFRVIKVYVSFISDNRGHDLAIAQLNQRTTFLCKHLVKCMNLPRTPEIHFIEHSHVNTHKMVYTMLDKMKALKMAEGQDEMQFLSSGLSEDDCFWDEDGFWGVDPNNSLLDQLVSR